MRLFGQPHIFGTPLGQSAAAGGGVAANQLDLYFESYVPVLRYRLEEIEGTTVENSGSAGAVLDGTLSGTYTLGVAGEALNAGKGIDCDGSTSKIDFLHDAAISGFAEMTILAVARSDSAGESSLGTFITKSNEWTFYQGGIARVSFTRNYTGEGAVNASAISSFNQIVYGNTYAFAARIGADGVPHLFVNGVELSYGTQTTGVGTPAATANNGAVAAATSGANTFDGLVLDLAVVEGALSNAAIQEHYEAAFLADATAERAVAFSGTSITEAKPTGYRPLTQAHLTNTYPFVRFTYPLSAYSGSSTWVRLWYMYADLIDIDAVNCIIYEAVSANYEGEYAEQAEAIEEGAIRRLRAGQPTARILVVGMPTFADNTTPGPTNSNQLMFLQALCAQYGMTYVDWPGRIQDLLDAETYTLDQLYNDLVHPSTAGHAELKALLVETLTLAFINGADDWSGDLGDYPAEYDDGTFEVADNYIARNGTDNDGTTGTWTTDGTTLVSNDADATVTFSGTFETFGIEIDSTEAFTIQHNFDGGGWATDNYTADIRAIHQLAPNFSTRGAHTVQFKVVSGTARIRRFLAI